MSKCQISMTKWRNMSHMLKDYYKAIEALKDCRKFLVYLENRAFVYDGLVETKECLNNAIIHFEEMDGSK